MAASSGVLSSARALPAIADAVQGDLTILVDSGVRSGQDVVRLLALGANGVLLARPSSEMKVAMTFTGGEDDWGDFAGESDGERLLMHKQTRLKDTIGRAMTTAIPTANN